VMSAGVANLFAIIKACDNQKEWNELMNNFNQGVLKYKDLKEITADSLVNKFRPLRERRAALSANPEKMKRTINELSAVAREYAENTLDEVKNLTGLISV
jgi:tryptophanyl-tRNA synthetase